MLFPEPEGSTNSRFMFNGKVEISLRGDEPVLMIFSFLRVERNVVANDMFMM